MMSSSVRKIFLHTILLQLASFHTFLVAGAETCDMCMFTSDDSQDCKVYGQLGDDVLIGWSKASQQCLDAYNIKSQSMDPIRLNSMFPNSNGSEGNVGSFVSFLRSDSGSVADTIKAGYPDFFEEDETKNNLNVLKDTVMAANGDTIDCSVSASNCYNALKDYLAVEPGLTEMAQSGCALHNTAALDREKEQSLIRIRLCQEVSSGVDPTCETLANEVQNKMNENPNKFCSAYGLGPARENKIPGCSSKTIDYCESSNGDDGPAHTPGGTSSAPIAIGKMWIGLGIAVFLSMVGY